MGLFDFLFAEKRESRLMEDKSSRAVAIVVSYTPDAACDTPNCGKAVFKMKKDGQWGEYDVVLVENFGTLTPGEQWIVKCDEGFERIVTPQLKLSRKSIYRIADAD